MEFLSWIWWLIANVFGLALSIVWFLLGGWVATLAQIGVIAFVIFGYKYGWRRAPQEVLAKLGTVGRFAWSWIRARDYAPAQPAGSARPQDTRVAKPRSRALRQPGDVNLSTLLNVLMLAGLAVTLFVA